MMAEVQGDEKELNCSTWLYWASDRLLFTRPIKNVHVERRGCEIMITVFDCEGYVMKSRTFTNIPKDRTLRYQVFTRRMGLHYLITAREVDDSC